MLIELKNIVIIINILERLIKAYGRIRYILNCS